MIDAVLKIFKKKALGDEDEIKDYISKLQAKIKEKTLNLKENNDMNWMVIYISETFIIYFTENK